MLAGGAEATICPIGIAGFAQARALSTNFNDQPEQASRPYDKDRDGFVMGEGAGVVVLEEYEHAKARGAKIYAEVSATACRATPITSPRRTRKARAPIRSMEMALKKAGLQPSDIDYINAHGTSTPLGDELELGAVRRLFGDAIANVSMSSTKSAIGHLLGGAGAVESIFCILAMRDQIVPPTLNLDNPERGHRRRRPRAAQGQAAAGERGAQQQLRLRRHQRQPGHEGRVRRLLLIGAAALVLAALIVVYALVVGAGPEAGPAHDHRPGRRDARLGRAPAREGRRDPGLGADLYVDGAAVRFAATRSRPASSRSRRAWAARRSSTCCSTASRSSGWSPSPRACPRSWSRSGSRPTRISPARRRRRGRLGAARQLRLQRGETRAALVARMQAAMTKTLDELWPKRTHRLPGRDARSRRSSSPRSSRRKPASRASGRWSPASIATACGSA